MLGVLLISILTLIALIMVIIIKPEMKLFKYKLESFWVVSVVGAAFLIALNYISIKDITIKLFNNSSINPVKILVLFLSMTILSIVLDELGFFQKLAYLALKKAKEKQIKIFIYLYITISLLTIFTSNDIIILTFTPFICYFTKYAKINPIPYLISEFVAANSWSMMFVIGNPTNIYLASSYNIDFISYFQIMFLPTLVSSLFAFLLLYFIFKKDLRKEITTPDNLDFKLKNKTLVILALIHLSLCTILLIISSYLNLEMWYICLTFALSILVILFLYEINKNRKSYIFINTIKRAPWSLVPFVISMFVFVLTLGSHGITLDIANMLNRFNDDFAYGLASFFSANIMNNIPMTVFFSEILKTNPNSSLAIFSTIVGSNLGAILTPIGALAGIMWMRILKKEQINLSFGKFIKYGIIISIPTIFVSLLILSLM